MRIEVAIMKIAMINVAKELKEKDLKSKIVSPLSTFPVFPGDREGVSS